MPDETTTNPPIPPLAEISSAMAPVIYFDMVPNFAFNGGIASLTLETIIFLRSGSKVRTERRAVAHLRTSIKGLAQLKKAINAIELAAEPADKKTAITATH
jgi:hypothetical protein